MNKLLCISLFLLSFCEHKAMNPNLEDRVNVACQSARQHSIKLAYLCLSLVAASVILALQNHDRSSDNPPTPTPTPPVPPIGDCNAPAFAPDGSLIAKDSFRISILACGGCYNGLSDTICVNTSDAHYNARINNLTRAGLVTILEDYCGPLNRTRPQHICFYDTSESSLSWTDYQCSSNPPLDSPFQLINNYGTCFLNFGGCSICLPGHEKPTSQPIKPLKNLLNKKSKRNLERELYGKPLDFKNKTSRQHTSKGPHKRTWR